MDGLCANPDGGEHLDDGGVPHLDKTTGQVVDLCGVCTEQHAEDSHWRYERLYEYEEPTTEGGSAHVGDGRTGGSAPGGA